MKVFLHLVAPILGQIFLILYSCHVRAFFGEDLINKRVKTNENDINNKNNHRSQLSEWLIGDDSDQLLHLGTMKQLTADAITTFPIDHEQVPIANKQNEAIERPDFEPASCQLANVVLVLQRPGCQPKAVSSFACTGSCPSYVQVSKSSDWKHERSCSCCQHTSIQEDSFVLDCPALMPPYREIKTYAPVNCICRLCSDISRETIKPQELVEALEGQTSTTRR